MDPTNGKAQARIKWEKGCTWSAIGVALVIVFMVTPLFSSHGCGGHDSRGGATISNIRQVALALLMYSENNDGRLPPSFATNAELLGAVSSYLPKGRVYETKNPNGGEFLPNANLAGAMPKSLFDPARTAMVYETEEWPQRGKLFAFVDGHAKFVRDPSLVQMMEDRIVQTRSVYPPWNAFDNAMSYKFKIDGQAYLLSWSQTRTYEVLLEKWGPSTWEVVWQGTTMGTPIIQQDKNELRLYLSQPWFQIGMREAPAGQSYYEVVTVAKGGVKSAIVQSRTMVE